MLYAEAVDLLRQEKLLYQQSGSKLLGQYRAAEAIENWVSDEFLKHTSISDVGNTLYAKAMIGFLYKEAIHLLQTGGFGVDILGAKEIADTVDRWVKKEFLKRINIKL